MANVFIFKARAPVGAESTTKALAIDDLEM